MRYAPLHALDRAVRFVHAPYALARFESKPRAPSNKHPAA